jgi:hypothetical protein
MAQRELAAAARRCGCCCRACGRALAALVALLASWQLCCLALAAALPQQQWYCQLLAPQECGAMRCLLCAPPESCQ